MKAATSRSASPSSSFAITHEAHRPRDLGSSSAAPPCTAYLTTIVDGRLEARSADDLLAPQAVKRLLDPAEVGAAAAWLLGPEAGAFTGAPLVLDLG